MPLAKNPLIERGELANPAPPLGRMAATKPQGTPVTTSKPVLLVNPNRMKPAVAPLALDYLADALERQGLEVAPLDLCFAPDPAVAIAEGLSQLDPILVAVTVRNTDDVYMASQDFFIPRLKEITDAIKELTQAPIVLGGAGFSVAPEAILDFCDLEWGLWGEGETALPELAQRLAQGKPFRDIPGLVYRNGPRFRRNPPRFLPLHQTPAPQRGFVELGRYFQEGGQGNIETKRGCPQACTYCADPVGKGRQSRLRSPATVADEVEQLLSLGIDTLHLCDSEFNIPEDHAQAVCQELIGRGLGKKVKWYAYLAPAPFSRELATLMRRAGAVGVDFGADSGHAGILRRLGRDFGPEQLAETARLCHQEGLIFMYDLLLGGPGETRETLAETIELMKRLSPHRVGVSLGVRLFPGTALARQVKKEGPLEANPNLRGQVRSNDSLLAPIFYLSAALGDDAEDYLRRLIGGDERFFLPSAEAADQNYNYNDNSVLVEAIRKGYRGAYWDILRRLAEASS